MFTICPKCALTLAVTAADLRVAQGYVRCGRCSSVFNALARLTEERQGASPESSSPPATSPGVPVSPAASPSPSLSLESVTPDPDPQPVASAPPSQTAASPAVTAGAALDEETAAAADVDVIPEEALEFNPSTTDAESVFVQPRPDPQWEAATGSFKAMVAANQDPALELEPDGLVEVEIDSLFLSAIIQADARGTTLAVAPAPAPTTTLAPAPAPAVTPERTPAPVSAATPAPAHIPVSTPAASRRAPARPPGLRQAMPHPRPAQDADTRPDFEGESLPAREPQAEPVQVLSRAQLRERAAPVDVDAAADEPGIERLPYQWLLGIAGAVVLLFAQIVNHYRDDLAASASFNHPLTALYASLGVTLNPHWDLHAYDVRQLGASVDPANSGNITVRASIKNAGPQPQPLPLLRVTLQDRFGNRIATRDVRPQSYVPGAVPASALLGAGQRIDAEMAFIDPGASAVGFELDACLPASGGGVACANDAGAR
jgi:predicted Zn finger-like uncharacterized protein